MFLAVAVLRGLAFAYISDLTLFQAPHTPYALSTQAVSPVTPACPCSSERQHSKVVDSRSSGSSLPALLLSRFVIVDKLFNLPVLQFPYL